MPEVCANCPAQCPGQCYSKAYQQALSHAAMQIMHLTNAHTELQLRVMELEARINAQGDLLVKRRHP